MKNLFYLVLAGVVFPIPSARAADESVVTVNGVSITQRQVIAECDNRINAAEARDAAHGLALDESMRQLARDAVRAEAVNALIERVLIAQQLAADSIEITAAEVDAAFDAKAAAMGQTPAEARAQIVAHGRTVRAVKDRIRWNILGVEQLYRAHAEKQATLSEAAARALYDAYPGEYDVEERRRVSHILIRVSPEADADAKAAARARAEKLLARLHAGEDFAALAAASSDDVATAASGGDRGFSPRGIILDENTDPFGNAAFSMTTIGAVSDVVATPEGFHIIKLTDLQPARRQPFDEVKRGLIDGFHYREVARFWEDIGRKLHAAAVLKWSPEEVQRQSDAAERQRKFNEHVESLVAKEKPNVVTGARNMVEVLPGGTTKSTRRGLVAKPGE